MEQKMIDKAKKAISLILATMVGATGSYLLSDGQYTTLTEIEQAEQEYFQNHGRYRQVIKGNINPSYELNTINYDLGKKIPDDMQIDIYRTPDGQEGYRILIDTSTQQISVGYGPLMNELTYIKKTQNATTTIP